MGDFALDLTDALEGSPFGLCLAGARAYERVALRSWRRPP